MNFTQEIKRELIKKAPPSAEERLALFGGLLDAGGRPFEGGFAFTSESESTAQYLLSLAEGLGGVQMTLTEAVYDPKQGKDKLTFFLTGVPMPFSAEEGEACALAYVTGAFLGGGSCTLPRAGKKTGYHLEFGFSGGEGAERFSEIFEGLGFVSNLVKRGGHDVVYVKSREAISDFLSVTGALGALEKLDEVSAEREASNAENRVNNCLGSNADRAAIASVEQVRKIEALRERGKLALLSEELQDTAAARLEHPELSLFELASLLGLTKSCLSHRLTRLIQLAKKEEEE